MTTQKESSNIPSQILELEQALLLVWNALDLRIFNTNYFLQMLQRLEHRTKKDLPTAEVSNANPIRDNDFLESLNSNQEINGQVSDIIKSVLETINSLNNTNNGLALTSLATLESVYAELSAQRAKKLEQQEVVELMIKLLTKQLAQTLAPLHFPVVHATLLPIIGGEIATANNAISINELRTSLIKAGQGVSINPSNEFANVAYVQLTCTNDIAGSSRKKLTEKIPVIKRESGQHYFVIPQFNEKELILADGRETNVPVFIATYDEKGQEISEVEIPQLSTDDVDMILTEKYQRFIEFLTPEDIKALRYVSRNNSEEFKTKLRTILRDKIHNDIKAGKFVRINQKGRLTIPTKMYGIILRKLYLYSNYDAYSEEIELKTKIMGEHFGTVDPIPNKFERVQILGYSQDELFNPNGPVFNLMIPIQTTT